MIKKYSIKFLRFTHKKLKLDRLNKSELKGNLEIISRYKFLKKSEHNLQFENGLTIRGIPFNNLTYDSFGYCLQGLDIDKKIELNHFTDKLNNILNDEKNKKIKDYNGIFEKNENGEYPIWCFVYPWENLTIKRKLKIYPSLVLENRQCYLNDISFLENMYDEKLAESHYNQFLQIISTLNKDGFDYKYERPRIIILKYKKKWKWIMSGQGNHRAYSCFLLGFSALPVEIVSIFDFDKQIHNKIISHPDYDTNSLKRLADYLFDENNKRNLRGVV